jgi:hypothetical protein
MHGGRLRTFLNFMGENKIFAFAAGAASIVGLLLAIWAFL